MKVLVNLIKFFIILILLMEDAVSSIPYSPEVIITNKRYSTPTMEDKDTHGRPEIFGRTNNLRRFTGSPFLAKGDYLFIDGYLTDLANVPIENAIIKIWHANMMGYYNHLIKQREDDLKYDVDFVGSGTCVTDNLGYYSFITIMPGYYSARAPHIHMIIKHDFFSDEYETQMFFPGHPRNLNDKIYLSLGPLQRSLLTAKISLINENNPGDGKRALFNIKLDWIHPTKRY